MPASSASLDSGSPAGEPPRRSLYDVLGVSRNATHEEIVRAYRKLALIHHPDKNPTADSHARFVELQEAKNVLADPARRRVYDALREHGTSFLARADHFLPPWLLDLFSLVLRFSTFFFFLILLETILLPLFLILKVDGTVSWPWPVVFIPVWLLLAVLIGVVVFSAVHRSSLPENWQESLAGAARMAEAAAMYQQQQHPHPHPHSPGAAYTGGSSSDPFAGDDDEEAAAAAAAASINAEDLLPRPRSAGRPDPGTDRADGVSTTAGVGGAGDDAAAAGAAGGGGSTAGGAAGLDGAGDGLDDDEAVSYRRGAFFSPVFALVVLLLTVFAALLATYLGTGGTAPPPFVVASPLLLLSALALVRQLLEFRSYREPREWLFISTVYAFSASPRVLVPLRLCEWLLPTLQIVLLGLRVGGGAAPLAGASWWLVLLPALLYCALQIVWRFADARRSHSGEELLHDHELRVRAGLAAIRSLLLAVLYFFALPSVLALAAVLSQPPDTVSAAVVFVPAWVLLGLALCIGGAILLLLTLATRRDGVAAGGDGSPGAAGEQYVPVPSQDPDAGGSRPPLTYHTFAPA